MLLDVNKINGLIEEVKSLSDRVNELEAKYIQQDIPESDDDNCDDEKHSNIDTINSKYYANQFKNFKSPYVRTNIRTEDNRTRLYRIVTNRSALGFEIDVHMMTPGEALSTAKYLHRIFSKIEE